MSLFHKYGGSATVSRIVTGFYSDVFKQPHLRAYFDGVALPQLIQHQVRFVSLVMGQTPSGYSGRSMAEAHGRLNITKEHFAEVAEILEANLTKAGVEEADLRTLMAAVAELQYDVVGA